MTSGPAYWLPGTRLQGQVVFTSEACTQEIVPWPVPMLPAQPLLLPAGLICLLGLQLAVGNHLTDISTVIQDSRC